ncbi:MAG: hypothetical protein BM564_06405 [Bacteroidetes bacterium MedPE-SWsnd-G2]|nr:MAG: hypothetical protein BM564_06405 [Bacteroidetes bacterium MedPE-SWsnd-G2]
MFLNKQKISPYSLTFLSVKHIDNEIYIPVNSIACIYKKKDIFYVVGAFKFKLSLKIKSLSELPVNFTQGDYLKLNKNTIVRKEKTKITYGLSYTEAIVSNGFHTCYFKIPKELEINFKTSLYKEINQRKAYSVEQKN